MTGAERHKLRALWLDMMKNYDATKATVLQLMLNPQATAEHVMPAKQTLCEMHTSVMKTQRKLEKLGVLGLADPRINDIK